LIEFTFMREIIEINLPAAKNQAEKKCR